MTIQRAASAGIWTTADLFARQVIGFVAVVVLARLLGPDTFGVFAIPVLLTTLMTTALSGGPSTVIVQRQGLEQADLERIFTALLAASVAGGVVILASGHWLASYFEAAELAAITPVLALHPVISMATTVPRALLAKRMNFRALATIGWASSIVGAGAGVALAFAGAGIWALVAQALVSTVIDAVGAWAMAGWRARLRFDLAALRPLLPFAASVSLVQALQVLQAQGFSLIIGKRFSVADVALYNRGFGVAQVPSQLFCGLVGRVALPLMAELSNDLATLRSALRQGTTALMLLSTPVFIGLAYLSKDLVLVLYGEQWVAAWPVLAILAAGGILAPWHAANVQVLISLGMGGAHLGNELRKRGIGITLVLGASFFGIVWVAAAAFASLVISTWMSAERLRPLIGMGFVEQVRDLRDVWIANVAMVIVLVGCDLATEPGPIARIIVLSGVGCIAYIGAGFLLRLPAFTAALTEVRRLQPSR